MFFSKQTNGFYDKQIHGSAMPEDVVEITDDAYQSLLEEQSQGKQISGDERGFPVAKDPGPPTEQELRAAQNEKARRYLAETDWYVVRFAETGTPIPEDIRAAREAARDSVKG